jgi:hypothetical protein
MEKQKKTSSSSQGCTISLQRFGASVASLRGPSIKKGAAKWGQNNYFTYKEKYFVPNRF